MCSIEAHEKNYKSVNENKHVSYETSSSDDRPLLSNLIEETLKSFCETLNFIESWLKSFNMIFLKEIAIFCE